MDTARSLGGSMITEDKIIDGTPYLLLDVNPITQKSNTFYVGKMRASDLLKIFTVSPTKYDFNKNVSLSETFVSDADYYDYISSITVGTDKEQGFQRDLKIQRVKEIKKFLEMEDEPFFPNAIIATCGLINDSEEFELDTNSQYEDFKNLSKRPSHLSFIYQDKATKQFKLLIPKTDGVVLIIDGQHRLEGLRGCSLEYQKNYDILVSFIIGYDRSVIAKQFYTINYEQKSVNKSLLLHLTAEFRQGEEQIIFLHNVVKLLNEHSTSPFQKRIKMLGVIPPEVKDPEERRRFSVSQAFMIGHMERFIDRRLMTSEKYPPIFLYYFQNESYRINIIRFIISYFSAIREMNPEWENPQFSVLSKGMGVGAFFASLHTIFPIMFVREWEMDPDKIKEVNIDTFKGILRGIEDINFTHSGEFTGGGGDGTINKIKNHILEKISYEEGDEKKQFKAWLEKKY